MDNEFQQRIKLHTECFGDKREWTERYIKRNDIPSRKVTLYDEGGKIAATLYLEPMELAVKNTKIPFEFINCLGTLPELRDRGYATRLIGKTFETHGDCPLLALLPFNEEFYLKQGFVPLNKAEWETISGKEQFETRLYDVGDFEFCRSAYEKSTERFDAYVARSEEFLKWKFVDEMRFDDGSTKIIIKDGKAVGYVCFSDDEKIGEYAMLEPYDLSEVSALNGNKFLRFGKGSTYMMARICNAEKMLKIIPYSERFDGTLTFNLSDKRIPLNEGNYTLTIVAGKLVNFEKREISAHCGDTLSAEQLTSLSLGRFDAETLAVPARIKSAFDKRNTLFYDIF